MTHEKDDEPKLEFGGAFGPGPRETVADLLRRARIDCGQDLPAVAGILRIRQTYLEAIETGEFDRLPGPAYAVGFLRTYAEYLGLDGEEMVERFKAETQAAARRSELIFPEPVAEGRIPGGAIILVSVILLAVAYGGWFYLSQQGRSVADLLPAWPAQTQTAVSEAGTTSTETAPVAAGNSAPAPAPETSIVTPAAAQANAPTATETAVAAEPETPEPALESEPEPPAATASSSPPPVEATPPTPIETAPTTVAAATPAPVPAPTPASPPAVASSPANARAPAPAAAPPATTPAPAASPAPVAALNEDTVVIPAPPLSSETVIIPDDQSPRVYGGNNGESRITLRAARDTWVQVRDSQNAILLTRVLRTGDTYRVPNASGLTLLTGDAGGIEIEVDGVRLPPIGPSGVVRRNIALDPAQLLSGASSSE
jgi:cytoskeletal protein RodZ